MRKYGWLQNMFAVESSFIYAIISVGVSYFAAPISIYLFLDPREEYLSLAFYSLITLFFLSVGYRFRVFDPSIISTKGKIRVPDGLISKWISITFIAFVIVTLATAPSIPILSALNGSDVSSLSDERGEFLKGRAGGWIVLSYLSTLFTGFLVPYALIDVFSARQKFRYLLLIFALTYSISFLVKGLFLNFVLPFLVWWTERKLLTARSLIGFGAAMIGVLIVLIQISGYGALEGASGYNLGEFFSTLYVPNSSVDFFLYRSISIPIFSVADTLYIHANDLNGKMLFGRTSTLIAKLIGESRVDIEKMVFAYQYGGWNDFGNANVVYIADAFINFGYIGLGVYGFLVGYILRIFRLSSDIGLRSLSVLFVCLMYSSPLIGMLLSNGYVLVFLFAFFVRIGKKA
jgi:hypothetical protein